MFFKNQTELVNQYFMLVTHVRLQQELPRVDRVLDEETGPWAGVRWLAGGGPHPSGEERRLASNIPDQSFIGF